jgi:PleD family two-component response regulator
MRKTVAGHEFGLVGRLTVSVGATRYRAGDDRDTLFQRADDALYQAKQTGRDRVVIG